MAVRPFLHLPPPPRDPDGRRLWEVVAQVRRGKIDAVSTFTLTANAASSVLNFKGLSPQSVVIFDPKTANAATELYGGTMYALTANRGNDQWTVTHANNAQADRTFQVLVMS
jgi:hypothetical protein